MESIVAGKKLDLSATWDEAVAMLVTNKSVMLVVAGVFFFLPNAISGLFTPMQEELPMPTNAAGEPDFEKLAEQFGEMMGTMYGDIWWIFVLVALVQAVGTLGLLVLLTNANRPTVGEALNAGVKALVPYIAAYLIFGMAAGLLLVVATMLGAAIGPALAVLLVLVALIVIIYAMIKTALVAPVIAIEGEFNPLRALQRSWQLTKGNSLRVFAFYLLLGLAVLVISLIFSIFLGLAAVLGETAAHIVTSLGAGIMAMISSTVMVAVLAALYRQLSGASTPGTSAVFD